MLKVGLTGNIGSGKSTCAKIFSKLGIPIFYSDIEAKALYHSDFLNEIESVFGNKVIINGNINSEELANIIFNDKEALSKLNLMVIPRLRRKFEHWVSQQHAPYVIFESAIIIENNAIDYFDKIILVIAPEEQRIARSIKRDNSDNQKIMARIRNQLPESQKIALCDFIIDNEEHIDPIPQIKIIHEKLVKL